MQAYLNTFYSYPKMIYPTPERVIAYNILALKFINVKKADQPKVLSRNKIVESLKACEEQQGDLYDKAAVLLRTLIQKHPFASGNRRTAFITTKDFIITNTHILHIKDNPTLAKVMQGIRENYYTHEEIKEWLKHGKIKTFQR